MREMKLIDPYENYDFVIQQDNNFDFIAIKNRYGERGIVISPNRVQQLLDSSYKVGLIGEHGYMLSDNTLKHRKPTQDELINI